MRIGPFVRHLMGRLERPISTAYRCMFIDLEDLVYRIKSWCPDAEALRILEVGCGEGMLVEQLANAYQKAHITGIDVTPGIGRLFEGDTSRISFRQQTISDFASENPCSVDLLVICDVMHHVPSTMHRELLSCARSTLKPEGYLVLKDWERDATPIHMLCYLMERFITGDRIAYKTAAEFRLLIEDVFGAGHISNEVTIGPWKNNIVFLAHC